MVKKQNLINIEGGGTGDIPFREIAMRKNLKKIERKKFLEIEKFSNATKYQPKQKALKKVNRGYVSSYLDVSVNKPGKYGVDY